MYPDQLYQLAFAFRKTKLWKFFYDSELFAVSLPNGETGYCSVMGSLGEHLALALYVGDSGLDCFRFLQEPAFEARNPLKTWEVMLSQKCLQCSFENKDELSPQELSAVRAYAAKHRISFRGGRAFPQFTAYSPARCPCPVSGQTDIQLLCAALEAALEVSERLESGRKSRLGFQEGPAYDRSIPLLVRSGEGYAWSMHPLPPKRPVRYPEPSLTDELLLARLKKSKKRGGPWVCDVVMVPQPSAEDETSAPVFPYTLLTAIQETEAALPTELVPDLESGAETLLWALGEQMLEHSVPGEIQVADERTYALLKNLAAELRIKLTLQPENGLLDGMEADFLDCFNMGMPDIAEDGSAYISDLFLTLDDDTLLSMPDELLEQLRALERQGLLNEDIAERLRGLSKFKE